ncbi:beta-galactosidase GalA [Asticcacaulis sp. AC460]|uniref:beta-galactosidase GalA n=1 Tax=Asticcacaulis sp. AC460 TaxID=1282360 RepID=UPI000428B5A4|nr:beta-galactosidase GalA [Asticcacaulis sp. AC460]
MKPLLMAAAAALILAANLTAPQAIAAETVQTSPTATRERVNIDKDWRFAYGHADDAEKDFRHGLRPFFFAKAGFGDGPANPDFSDTAWRQVDLPHDWAVELPFDGRGNTNHGSKAIGHPFPENSVGWYRKVIDIPAADKGRRIALEFDGVYRDSVVWVNGHYIGTEPSGYSGFRYDITDYLNYGGRNVIAVRADATTEEGWFYEGAGIYRHVWLTRTDPLHVAQWGTFVRTTVDGAKARLDIDVTVQNDGKTGETFAIRQEVFAPDGRKVAEGETANLTVKAVTDGDFTSTLAVDQAQLWSLETPHLYRLRTTIIKNGVVRDSYDTTFGIRTVVFDPDKGFFLNGKNLKLQGTNNHQDHAGVGVALPDGLQAWRVKQLKSYGVNTYRASHHPPTPELLDEADRQGMLVIDEHRMMGTTPEIRGQMERMIRRDRNHPSVILWSVGNEEWALEWSPLGTHLATEMQDDVRRLDPTRRTTVATSGSGQGVSLAADVIGFNYGAQHDVDGFHRAHPEKPALMSEEGSTLTTRGIYVDDRAASHLNAYDRQGRPGNSLSIEEGWRRVQDRPWMSGMVIWTGFDYRGETTPFGWPAVSSQFGMTDTTGVLKDTAYYLKSVWTQQPMVHILPHWNWAGREGVAIDVRVYSNGDAVELFQDGKSLGRQTLVKDSHLQWSVPYKPGKLTAKSYLDGKLVASNEVVTTGAPATLTLTPDTTALKADGTDISVVWVNVTDKAGRIIPIARNGVSFETTGPIRIIGVGNGDPGSHEADRPAERHAFHALSEWRSLALDSLDGGPAVSATADTSTWRDPTQWLPPEAQPPATKGLVLRGQFARPDMAPGDVAVLFIDALADGQTVYVNGQAVTPKTIDGALVVELDAATLKDSNSLTYVFTTPQGGVQGMYDRSVGATKWGTLRITTPAAPWQRSVFNGWAQVIVQSTGEPGQATLKAVSDGLKPAVATFTVRSPS